MPQLTIQLDPLGGAAGDMFIACVLHAFPHLQDGLIETVRKAGLPEAVLLDIKPHADYALTGLQFGIDEPAPQAETHDHPHHPPDHGHGHAHHHSHRAFSDIRDHLSAAAIPTRVKRHAIGIFTLVAEAEATVHGKSVESVSFHELGEWDSIADIVGAAFLIAALDAHWHVGPLPLGSGIVDTAHGPLPVPAPATALLLQGFPCIDDGIGGERVTPTGAAILKYLQANQPRPQTLGSLCAVGLGFGTRQLAGRSNVLRLLAFAQQDPATNDLISEIVFEVDDQSPEDLALGIDSLRQHPGVRDVVQLAATGKKGRMTIQVRVLADPAQEEAVCDACFKQTTSIGLRLQRVARKVLPRQEFEVSTDGFSAGIKAVTRGAQTTLKAEADAIADIAGMAGGHSERQQARRQLEDRARQEIEPS